MKNIKYIAIGIQPATKMFRLNSLSGQIIDAILEKRDSSKTLGSDYYVNVSSKITSNEYALSSKNNENVLQLHQDNIIFRKSFYKSNKHYDFNTVLSEFREIWKEINKILVVKNIRRIGIVCESRFPIKSPSINLLNNLTKLTSSDHCERFNIHFENVKIAQDGVVPDKNKSDFIKRITDIYDSAFDAENPTDDSANINVDVQRFYAPLTNGDVPDEVLKLYNKEYINALTDAQTKILALSQHKS